MLIFKSYNIIFPKIGKEIDSFHQLIVYLKFCTNTILHVHHPQVVCNGIHSSMIMRDNMHILLDFYILDGSKCSR
jgi:hypothetical protein